MTAIALNNVTKSFARDGQQVPALAPIDLEVAEGEFVCLVGPTACGKSTLLRIIAGLEQADTGTVFANGQPVTSPGPDRVVVFQEAALFPWLTVLENVEFGLKMLGKSKAERRGIALTHIKRVHLGRYINAFPHELSGGMKQRVAIARGLAMNPKILLMDEPFGALDAQTRSLLEMELQEIWAKDKRTIFFVTHNLREAVCLADTVYVMSARPGQLKNQHKVEFSRPRVEEDSNLNFLQRKLSGSLKEEIEKVAKQEIDLDYVVTKGGVLTPINRNLGSNI